MKTINFKDLEWIVLEENEDTTRLLLKEPMSAEMLDSLCPDKWYLINNYIRLSDCVKPPFNLDKSYVKTVVLKNFKDKLGIDCEVDLLSKEEAEILDDEIRDCNSDYWTKTNLDNTTFAVAYIVSYSKPIDGYNVSGISRLRPVITLKTSLLHPILDDKEREYLSAVIRPFRDKVVYIIKCVYPYKKEENLQIAIKDDYVIYFPCFPENSMYKGMEIRMCYGLEELGLYYGR